MGEVLLALQRSQESPNSKLLPKKTFKEAEIEAKKLYEKKEEEIFKNIREIDLDKLLYPMVSLNDGEFGYIPFLPGQKFTEKFSLGNADGIYSDKSGKITWLEDDKYVIVWESSEGINGRIINKDGISIGEDFLIKGFPDNFSVKNLNNRGRFVITWNKGSWRKDVIIEGLVFYEGDESLTSFPKFQVNIDEHKREVESLRDVLDNFLTQRS